MSRRSRSISGPFAPRLIEMLESPAHRVLSKAATRVIERIEIELYRHGGKDNGRLPVTLADFERFGLDRHSVPPAIREAVALGFVEITVRGCAGNADFRRPNLYRLTFREAKGYPGDDGTHEWRRIANDPNATEAANLATASAIARAARLAKDGRAVEKARRGHEKHMARKQNFGGDNSQVSGGKTPPENAPSIGLKTPPPAIGLKTPPTLDISGRVRAGDPVPPPPRRKTPKHRRPSTTTPKARAVPS